MNIFVSYGHKDYPDFVKRFVCDLEKDYTVWTDEKIKLDNTWVQEIDNAIRKADVFLFLMATDSVREGSYCYGEIIYAKNVRKKIIVVTLEEVIAPTIIAQEQYFSMNNVFDICGDLLEDEYLSALSRFLIKLEQCLLNTETNTDKQKNYLKYFDNEQRLKTLTSELVLDASFLTSIDEWLKSGKMHFALLGSAGSGKSTAAAAVYYKLKERAVIHFCDYANEKTTDTRKILQSVAKGFTTISKEYNNIISKTFNFERDINGLSVDDIFEELLLNPMAMLSENHPVSVIVIDGVDEIPQKQKRDFARIFLKRINELSGKLKIFFTSRKDSEIVPVLYAIGANVLDKYETFNNNSIKEYVGKYLTENSIFFDNNCLDKIIMQSKGDFLYVKFILEEIVLRKIADVTALVFPIGMKGVCQNYFDRIFSGDSDYYDEKVAPFLEIMTIIKTPISIEIIKTILKFDDIDIKQLIKKLDMFIELRDNSIMLVHKSIYDWLRNIKFGDKYYISLNRAQNNLCGYIEREFADKKNQFDDYTAEYGFLHLSENGRLEKIAEFISVEIKGVHIVFIRFVWQLLLDDKAELLIDLFHLLADDRYDGPNTDFIAAEVMKLIFQYGKKGIAEDIVDCFSGRKNHERLTLLMEFYKTKTSNESTAKIIEKGENLLKDTALNENIFAEITRILGDAYRENGHHVQAVKLYTDSKNKATENGQVSLFMDCECALIDMEYVIGNVDVALHALEQLKPKLNFKTPNIYTYKYYRLLGNIFHIKNEINEAMNAFSECLNISSVLAFPLKQIETNNSLAELQSNYEIAENYLENGRNLCASTGLNSLELGKSYYIEAGLLLNCKRYEEALNCTERAIEILEQVGYGSGCARSYLIKGRALFEKEEYKSALAYVEKAGKYYIRENIYPTLRLESYYYVLKCAEKIGVIDEYRKFDDNSYFSLTQFPHMQSVLEAIKCIN